MVEDVRNLFQVKVQKKLNSVYWNFLYFVGINRLFHYVKNIYAVIHKVLSAPRKDY